jgi:peptide/nickel transport system substrate-binding protein
VIVGWVADYPSAATFLHTLFSCAAFLPHSSGNRNFARFCNPRIDRLMRRAQMLEQSNPVRANRLWARSDRALTDAAVAIPLYNQTNVDLVAPTVGDYQSDPEVSGPVMDQLWVR